MTEKEYKELLYRSVAVSEQLTRMLSEEGQDLFEEYFELYEKMLRYQIEHEK